MHVFLLSLSVLLTQSYDLFPILCSDVQYNESSVMHVNKNPDVIFMHSVLVSVVVIRGLPLSTNFVDIRLCRFPRCGFWPL